MSSFWEDVKQTFSSPKQELDEASKAILDIENKKKAIFQASINEKNAIESKIRDVYRQIGETSYALHTEGNFELDKITDMFETIKGYFQTLDDNKVKLEEVLGRYDEELKILRPAPPADQAPCPNCGTAYVLGETVFCSNCGNKVPEKNVAESTFANQSACPNCNADLISDAMFCANCGQKLDAKKKINTTACCEKCGSQLGEESSFCNSCGTPVQNSSKLQQAGSILGSVIGVASTAVDTYNDVKDLLGKDE